jgi:CheY-like chemotaxis protein
VDDNPDVADTTAELLKLLGYEVRACYDGRAALDLAQTFQPNVCLIDLNMPGMDGDELAIKLRASGQPLKLVAVTATSNEVGSRRIREAGFDHHLIKPATLPHMLAAIGG